MTQAHRASAGRFPAGACLLYCLSLLGGPDSAWGRQVMVKTVDELHQAVSNAQPKDSILLEEGIYAVKGYLQIDGKTDLTLASRTGSAFKTVLKAVIQQ